MKNIYECPVYCGRTKVWRVLNLNTGTVYTKEHKSFEEASDSIDTLHKRNGWKVNRVTVNGLTKAMDDLEFLKTHNMP